MKTRFALIASLCLLAGCSAQGPDNRTADLRGKRVLVFTGHGEGYVHENIAASAAMILELAAQEDFVADTTSDKRVFCDDSLERYDAIVYANASYVGLDSAQRSAFERFIRRGGGFAGLHAATCTDNDWTWFTRMIGGRFDFHPPLQRLTMKVVDRTHPSASMLPDTLTTEDELYCFKRLDPRTGRVGNGRGRLGLGAEARSDVAEPAGRLVQRVRRRPDLVHRRRTPPVRLCRYALPRAGARRAPLDHGRPSARYRNGRVTARHYETAEPERGGRLTIPSGNGRPPAGRLRQNLFRAVETDDKADETKRAPYSRRATENKRNRATHGRIVVRSAAAESRRGKRRKPANDKEKRWN